MRRTAPPCRVIPPYLLARLAATGEPAVAEAARRTLAIDAGARTRRTERAAPPPNAAPARAPQRTIADAGHGYDLPGRLVRREGEAPVGDAAADESYDDMGATWSLLWEVYGRDSLDGAGLPLDATVHFGERYQNAFWNGDRMVIGDGDGVVFGRFSASVDVIGHELTHGLTAFTAALAYAGQPGALNESVSDVFGSLVRQRVRGQSAAEADWLIGAELLLPGVRGVALRSLKAPGTAYDDPRLGRDPQPATMSGYVTTTSDSGGVHINSGIPNHAFYLAATSIGGDAWDGAGRVWYDALTSGRVAASATFADFAEVTVDLAAQRFGIGSASHSAVRDAWTAVEVLT